MLGLAGVRRSQRAGTGRGIATTSATGQQGDIVFNRPRAVLLALAAVTAALFSGIAATPAQAAGAHPILNYGNRKCLDVATQNNVSVQLWSCNGQSQQQWTEQWSGSTLSIVNSRTGNCLGVWGNAWWDGARVVVLPCNNWSTVWTVSYAYNSGDGWHQQLLNTNSGRCLDLLNNNSANGTPIQLWDCWPNDPPGNPENNPAQLWML